MNKKAQIQQVFVYIITIVVVGLIFMIGYKAIGGMMSKGCDVEKTTFKTNLESFITKYTSYGEFHLEEMGVPCSFAQICFVDTGLIRNPPTTFTYPKNYIIESSVQDSDVEENIFMIKTDITEPLKFSPEVVVDGDIICINNTDGRFHLAFEGMGRETKISSGLE